MIVTDLNQPPRPGMIFLDLGSGPFGQSATLGDHRGSRTISGDASMSRINRRFECSISDIEKALDLHKARANHDAQDAGEGR